jgi:hypothetical protein
MTQFEQENDLGRGGGELDEESQRRAWENRGLPRTTADEAGEEPPAHDDAPDPAGDIDLAEAPRE